jgi:ketosteroid isomerase-like protein
VEAVNDHDLDALVDCFAEDYRNETPAHPQRGFRGAAQVRQNWGQLFAGIPDLRAQLQRACADDDMVWTEWEMSGTRRDGTPHLMRGVVIFGVTHRRAAWARFYLEPVEHTSGDVEAAIHAAARPSASMS